MNRIDCLSRNASTLLARLSIASLVLLNGLSMASAQSSDAVGWTKSRIRGTPDTPPPYTIEPLFEDVPAESLTDMIRVPQTDRWLLANDRGRIWSFSKNEPRDLVEVASTRDDFDTAGRKVYGMTFHPNFPSEPWIYVSYMTDPDASDGTRLSRFRVSDPRTPLIDPSSETVLLAWSGSGHAGGSLHFGIDGYLYISTGDAARPNPPDPLGTGQDISDLAASVLRIDVDQTSGDLPYRIPDDNPFVNHPGARGEVWAFGFRNPWKMAFDPKTHSLWAGDVGWEMMEMVYRVERGGNYGWSLMEGSQVVQKNGVQGPAPITPPTVEHSHLEARSISGGHFYGSPRLPELNDAYLYGDWITGKIWGLKHDGENVTWRKELADTTLRVIGFARDDDGEVLVLGYDGTVHRLVPNPAAEASADFPTRLSETGLFVSTVDQTPAMGVLPYAINAHHFADHTSSQQWVAIPDGEPLGIYGKPDWRTGQVVGDFVFPNNSVLAKTVFYTPDPSKPDVTERLETQVLHRNGDDWKAYNYVWNEDQTDAVLQANVSTARAIHIVDPREPDGVREQTWNHVSRDECLQCHFWNAGTVHGFKLSQLNRDDPFGNANQFDRLTDSGILPESVLAHPVADLEPMVSPLDQTATLEDRARSYLHLNCAHCHRNGGGGTAAFELLRGIPIADLGVIDALPTKGNFDLPDARVIAAGDPGRSVLFYRMLKAGPGHMPQFGPTMIDVEGVGLIHDWIASIDNQSPIGDSQAMAKDSTATMVSKLGELTVPLDRSSVAWIVQSLGNTADALRLSYACGDTTVDPAVRLAIAEIATQHDQSIIRDLFERFLPADRRVKRLGTEFDLTSLLTIGGDVEAGRRLYFESADVSCRQCHVITGGNSDLTVSANGKSAEVLGVGPDLAGIGAVRTREEILRSIVYPSEKIEPKYRGKMVLTIDGDLLAGMVVDEDADSMVLVDASAKRHEMAKADIDVIKAMETSVMPDRQFAEFTAQQAADLLAFLGSQTQQATDLSASTE